VRMINQDQSRRLIDEHAAISSRGT
jgi:hypothetical protein